MTSSLKAIYIFSVALQTIILTVSLKKWLKNILLRVDKSQTENNPVSVIVKSLKLSLENYMEAKYSPSWAFILRIMRSEGTTLL